MKEIFRALRYRNYRLYFFGQGLSFTGYWLTRVATGWLVYRMSGSAFLLGLIGFAGQMPTFFLVPFAGVLIDRWDVRRVLFVSQALLMIYPFALAWLALTGTIEIWHIFALSILQGVVNAFDIPSRQTLVVEMVERKKDLPNAIALNSTMFNAARLIGPSAAGLLIAGFGEGMCFLLDGISYFAVLYTVSAMKLKPVHKELRPFSMAEGLREGFVYAAGCLPIRELLGLVALISLMGMSYVVLLPVFARDVFHHGAETLGFLTAASGMGALSGALFLASRRNLLHLDRHLVQAAVAGGGGLILFSLSRHLALSFGAIFVAAFGMMLVLATSNTLLQSVVDDDKRARVMSFYTMAFLGMAPCGSLLAGLVAERAGAPLATGLAGAACIAAALLFSRNVAEIQRLIHGIYVKKGILPEIAAGLQAATEE